MTIHSNTDLSILHITAVLFNSGDTLYEVGEEPNFLLIILRGTYDCTQYSIESTWYYIQENLQHYYLLQSSILLCSIEFSDAVETTEGSHMTTVRSSSQGCCIGEGIYISNLIKGFTVSKIRYYIEHRFYC